MPNCRFGARHYLPLMLMAALLLGSIGKAQAQSERQLLACPLQLSSGEWDRCIGVWNAPEGDTVYSGEFGGGTFDGYGVLFIGRSRYSGQFRQGRMHGQGVLLWDDGQMYVGGFEEGVIAGFGRLLAADGREVFAGQFTSTTDTASRSRHVCCATPKASQSWSDRKPTRHAARLQRPFARNYSHLPMTTSLWWRAPSLPEPSLR